MSVATGLVAVAVFVGACLQSATGIGFGLVAGPALLAALAPSEAVGTVLALGLVLNLLLLFGERRRTQVRSGDVTRFVVAALPGLAVGLVALRMVSKPGLQVMVGLVVLLGAAARARASRQAGRAGGAADPPGNASAYPVGFASGALTTSIGVNGPPLALWLESRGAGAAELRDTVTATFVALNAGGMVTLAVGGELESPAGGHLGAVAGLAVLLGVVVAGHYIGRAAHLRLDPRAFDRAVLALVAVAGLTSVATGLAGLA